MKRKLTYLSLALSFVFVVTGSNAFALSLKKTSLYVKPISRLDLKNSVNAVTSSNWSGYAVENNFTRPTNNQFTQVLGSWVVPTVTCNLNTTYSSTWVGIDGYSDNSVEQTGTEQDCSGGTGHYYAWFEMYPQPEYEVNIPVNAGDAVTASVQYMGSYNYKLTLNDTTSNSSFSVTKRLSSARRQSVEWIQEAPSSWFGVLPLANFGTVNFNGSSATYAGKTGSISNLPTWQNQAINMMLNANVTKALTNPLTNSGSNFSVIWEHS